MLPVADAHELSLRDYVQIVRRRKLPLILSIIVVVLGSLIASYLQTPVYSATAEVLLQQRRSETLFDANTGQRNDPQRTLQTEIRILRSEPVRVAAREKLGYIAAVAVSPAGPTDVILIRSKSSSPHRAADIANAWATSYIEFKRKQAVDDLLAAAQEIQAKINDLQGQIDANSGGARDTLIQQQALFKNRLDQLQVDAALKTGGAQLVTRAAVPDVPISPRPLRSAMVAGVLGTLFGLGVAFLIEHMDDSVKSKADLERAAPSLSVIGMIPTVPNWRNRDEARLVSLTEPTSPTAEAYRTLRTSVQFLGLDRPLTSLQITSASAQVGKTTTAANLAVALARAGQKVVILSCDLRRPRIHEFFGLSSSVGVTSVLLGEATLATAVQKVSGVDRLFLLGSGPLPPNPSELLASARMSDLITALRDQGFLVLVDSPPVLPVTDGLVLAKQVDATLVVSLAGRTTRKEVARAMELLGQVGAPVVGAVLNGVSAEGEYGYAGRYGYATYQATPSPAGNGHKTKMDRRRGGRAGAFRGARGGPRRP